jgi:nucleoside-diphosphate-sugar epimerase
MFSKNYWKDLRLAIEGIPKIEHLKGRRILVTGATGMLCSSIVDLLLFMNREFDYGLRIYVAGRSRDLTLQRFSSFSSDDGIEFFYFDATASQPVNFVPEIDYLIHGASNAKPDLYLQQPVDTMLANILGLSKMLDLAQEKGARRLLYVSSSEIYGQKSDSMPFKEEDYGYLDILHKRAGYPSSKRAGESLCVAYSMQHGLDIVTVRPGHIYGPSIRESDNRASAEFTRRAVAGDDVELRSKGSQLRSYCYSLDCASAIITVLLEGEGSHAYNISNPNSICTISEMAEAIASAAGVSVKYDDTSGPPVAATSLMENASLDSEKLEGLGWTPTFNLEHGTSRMVVTLRESQSPFTI